MNTRTHISEMLIELLHDMKDQELLEDRAEYTIEDLMLAYDLSHENASTLYAMIQQQFK